MARIINLKKQKEPVVKKPGLKESPKKEGNLSVEPASAIVKMSIPSSKPSPSNLFWEAPSFYFNPEKKYLSLLIIALSAGGAAMLFFQKDTLTAIFLLLSSLVLILYANKRPEISKVTIDQAGVAIGDALYYYKDLKSFWIHYDPGNLKELSLESKRWYMPYVKVSIENKNPLEIRSLLISFIPEKEHEHSLVDIISRKIGL